MEDNFSAAGLIDSTASKIQQLQKAFAELESHRAITLNLKWKQLEEHFDGLQKSLKRRFTELEEQEKDFEIKIVESKEILEKRKAAVMTKEQASLERLQEKRDAAVASILNAMQNHEKPFSVDSCVSNSENQMEAPGIGEKVPDVMVTESSIDGMKKPIELINMEVKSYPELVKLCQEMNSEALHKFISDNRKNLATLREEIPSALKAAVDPASLVLDSLKGFYGVDMPNLDAKRDSNLLGIRRSCIMLMECLSSLFINLDGDSLSAIISENAKVRAKAIAEDWKPKLDDLDADASNGNSLEAHAFLQLLATFDINSDFDQESLSKLIPMVSRRRQTAELCRYLGLSENMPGVIDVLIKNGRQIDAVNLAFAFELTDQFSPISLLKSYLCEAKKVPSAAKSGNMSPAASTQGDVNEKQLTALKAVIKCIEDHKLEEQFPVDPLQKQVLEIEKAKVDKKRATEVAKPQSKRPRANGVGHVPRVATDKNFHGRMTDNRSKNVLFGVSRNYNALANQYLAFGKALLSTSEVSAVNEALKLMNDALELCEKGLRVVKRTEETFNLKELRLRTLRFIAATHLQSNEFESVLKCVKVLREVGSGGDNHPSLSVLAMKAWLGLGRHAEAEKELRGMVLNKGIPECVWVSAVESYFMAAGAAAAETVKGVFLGLLERCHVSAGAAIRVVNKVVGNGLNNGEGTKVRAKVVAELVSDERMVALFDREGAAKERTTMHALLWNCATEHFRSKDYLLSAEMFEKSMLYVPHGIENRNLRAKGYRVLCLCYLGLVQLDRAEEYIIEAEKLEPNIASSFLKFKIFLQLNDHNRAIAQMQAMPSCLDFTTDFISLAAHEAVACRSLPVAIASLSQLLNFYSSGKPMQLNEVVIFRTLVTLLSQDTANDEDILKHMKRALVRQSEVGPDLFFGTSEVGNREKNWFAAHAWNCGLRNRQEKNCDLSAEFFKLASVFYGIVGHGETEGNDVMVCKSIILAVYAIIAHEKNLKGTLLETEVREAIELLGRAGKILTSRSRKNDDQVGEIEPYFFLIYTWSAYDLYSRLSDMGAQQLQLVKNFASSKSCNPEYLLQIGLEASQGPRSNPEVGIFALNTSLSTLLASPSPEYQTVALVLRKLISIGSVQKGEPDDESIIEMYKKAYRIMVGLREGDYPSEEGKWLAMTAWNRAALPVKMGQIESAKKWMNLGLEVAMKVPGMHTYRSCMEDYLAGLEKILNRRDRNVAVS